MTQDEQLAKVGELFDGRIGAELSNKTIVNAINEICACGYARLQKSYNTSQEERYAEEICFFTKIKIGEYEYELTVDYDIFTDEIDDIEDFVDRVNDLSTLALSLADVS